MENPANYDPDNRLTYYLDFSQRAKSDIRLDDKGIPVYEHKGQVSKHPVYAMLYALGRCEIYRNTKDSNAKQSLLLIADWLISTQDESGGWKSSVTMPKFGLNHSFYSALIQGLAISTLVRANLLNQHEKYIESALKALKLFQTDIKNGGVSRIVDGYLFFEEYPSQKRHHVLNGFIYSLWGLLDLVRYNDNEKSRELWESGLKTLTDFLPQYDTGSWSLYHIGDGMKNPATITYHKIHIEQLKAMHAITGQKIFSDYAQKWQGYLDNPFNALKTLPQKIRWNLFRGL